MYTHMRKNRKLLLFTVSILFTFFGFINKVSAANCVYALPFSGYDYVNNKIYSFNYDTEVSHDMAISNSGYVIQRLSKPLSSTGLTTIEMGAKKFTFTSWLAGEKTYKQSYLSSSDKSLFNSGSCPKYIFINPTKTSITFSEATVNDYDKFLRSQDYLDLLNVRYETTSYDGSFSTTSLFYTIQNKAEKGDKIVFPIYQYSNSEKYDTEAVKVYNNIYTKKWQYTLEKSINNMKTSCGDDWYKYIEPSSNYHGEYKANQGAFIKYALGNTGTSENWNSGVDVDAPTGCLGFRRGFMKTWMSFYDYWTTLASANVTTGNKKLCFPAAVSDKSVDTNCVYFVDVFQRYTKFYEEALDVYIYVTRPGDKQVENNKDPKINEINGYQEQIDKINSYITSLSSDYCGGLCSSAINVDDILNTSQYDNCMNANQHSSCYLTALPKCKNSEICDNCKGYTGTALTECTKGCTNDIEKCMRDAGYSESITNKKAKIEELKKKRKELQDKIKGVKDSLTYKYEEADIGSIEWKRAKYTPKCTDIKVITNIWSFIKYLAPFLLMIFTGFDYFEVVMAADEAAMKKIKKSIPKRLIAFILLLVMPLLLKIFMENFGTNGSNKLGYLKCILTGDTTSGEVDTGSSSDSTDGNSGNSESNEDNNSNSNSNTNSSSTSSTNTSTNTNDSSSNTKKESSNKNNNTLNSAIEGIKKGIKSGVQESLDNSKNSNSVNNDEDQSDFHPEFSTTGR